MLGSTWSWLYWPDLALFHAATLTNRQLSFLSPPGVAAPFVPAGLVSENRTTNAAGKYCCARRGNTDTTQCKKASHPCPPAVTSMSQAPQARFRQNQTVWFGLDKPQVFAARAQLRSACGWISALRECGHNGKTANTDFTDQTSSSAEGSRIGGLRRSHHLSNVFVTASAPNEPIQDVMRRLRNRK